jgi:hypothetical protein
LFLDRYTRASVTRDVDPGSEHAEARRHSEISMNPLMKLMLRDGNQERRRESVPGSSQSEAQAWAAEGQAAVDNTPTVLEEIWQESSFDLRSGADITDFSDTIPTEVFDRLFKG